MANLDSFHGSWTPRLLSVLRIIMGFLLMPHGAQKLFGFMAMPGMPPATAFSLMWVAPYLNSARAPGEWRLRSSNRFSI